MEIIYIALLTILASGVGTLTGFGTSTIMVPVLLIFFLLPETLLLVGIIHWFGGIWKLLLFRQGIRWRLILGFGIPGIVASYLGASLTFKAPESLLAQVLGGFLIAYVIFLFINPAFKPSQRTINALSGGALSGFFAGVFGIGGAVRSAFLSTFDLPKVVYISTAGAIGLVIDSTRLATYLSGGTRLEPLLLWGLLLFIPASYLGARIAKRIVTKIPQKQFRTVIIGFFVFGRAEITIVSFVDLVPRYNKMWKINLNGAFYRPISGMHYDDWI